MTRLMNWKQTELQDKTDILTKFMRAGYSASEIAREFYNCTRNSIIGHIHRTRELDGMVGWSRPRKNPTDANAWKAKTRAKTPTIKVFPRRTNKPNPKTKVPFIKIQGDVWDIKNAPPGARLVTLEDLKKEHCKWIFDGPAPKTWCAGDRDTHPKYCDAHAVLVHYR